jgi:glycine cleavage system aminomethyltransferase T/glycine/D-amino acid oxidase-like deaminating enzyme
LSTNPGPTVSGADLPTKAEVVIIGAGIVGCSIAYHLAKKGVTDIVLVEKDRWPGPGGSTSHASDFIYPIDHSKVMTRLSTYGIGEYTEFGRYIQSGGLEVARTDERLEELKRKAASGMSWGVEAHVIGPNEVTDLFPFLDATKIKGAKYTPSAGLVSRSVDVAQEMVERAQQMGAVHLSANNAVTGIRVDHGRVKAVETAKGTIQTPIVLSAAGVWGPLIGEMAGAPIPLTPAHHPLVFTGPVAELENTSKRIEYPLLRDQDNSAYIRQEWNGFEFGYYETSKLRVMSAAELPHPDDVRLGLSPTMMPLQVEHVMAPLERMSELMPCMESAELNLEGSYNGVLSFTPDGAPILGESPEVRGFWMAEAVWVKDGPGVGKLMAEWLIDGEPELPVQTLDIARFYPHAKIRSFVLDRSTETGHRVYGIIHPREQYESGRDIRQTAFNSREKELDAVFFEAGGWERPQWYESNQGLVERYRDRIPERSNEWDARWWSPIINAEHLAMRDNVAMIDLSGFAKFEVSGAGALNYVQHMAVAQMDVRVGRMVYTPLLNRHGGVLADLTITRLGEDRFRIIAGGASGNMDKKWFMDELPEDGSVEFQDLTDSYSVLGVWGPNARRLIQSITDDDMSGDAFPFATGREITIGGVRVWALRISYVGELGWELYTPVHEGASLWDTLWDAGPQFGLIAGGIGMYLTTARMEKGYRLQGTDLETDYDAYESGVARSRVKPQDFLGRDAYMAARQQQPAARLCTLTVDDLHAADGGTRYMTGGEPILSLDGKSIVDARGRNSYVTSAADAPSLGEYILSCYLPPEHATEGEKLLVEYFGNRFPVTVAVVGNAPLFDPGNARLLG